jgi:hypothetical protein
MPTTDTAPYTVGQDLHWPGLRDAIQHYVHGQWRTRLSGSDQAQMRRSWDAQAGFTHVPRRLVLSGVVRSQD